MSNEDLRSNPRIDNLNLVDVTKFDQDGFAADLTMGRTTNLSEGGIELEMEGHIPLGSTLDMELMLGEQGLVKVRGQVRHLQLVMNGRCRMGIQFNNLPEDIRTKIKVHLANMD